MGPESGNALNALIPNFFIAACYQNQLDEGLKGSTLFLIVTKMGFDAHLSYHRPIYEQF